MQHELSFNDRITKLNQSIANSNKIVFFGGAGVSTESGIPDFRSKNGLYNQHDIDFDRYNPEYLLSRDCLFNNPKVFYSFYRQKLNTKGISPNIAHYKLAEMESKGKLAGIITQNIDNLHDMAGSRRVYAIHGTVSRNYCAYCQKEYPSDYIFNSSDVIPRCDCERHGLIRPAVTLYGESLPKNAWDCATDLIYDADMVIVAGTSLCVQPAASLISNYRNKRTLVIINNQETPYDDLADIVFRENIGDVFSRIELSE